MVVANGPPYDIDALLRDVIPVDTDGHQTGGENPIGLLSVLGGSSRGNRERVGSQSGVPEQSVQHGFLALHIGRVDRGFGWGDHMKMCKHGLQYIR